MTYEVNDNYASNTIEIEYNFNYKDLECYIALSCFGWRCAYIKLPKDHKYYGRHAQTLCFIDCHGGVNVAGNCCPCINNTDEGWIIGWDYNHQGDAYDFDAVERLFGEGTINDLKQRYYFASSNTIYHGNNCRHYSVDDIVNEIKYVIDKYEL